MRNLLLCPICHRPKGFADIICTECKTQLDSECFDFWMSRCLDCRYPLADSLYICDRCRFGKRNAVYPVSRYEGRLSYSVLDSFKFHAHKEMAPVVAMYLKRAIDILDPSGKAVIVPIPCSSARLKRFGWDQMVEVCKALGRKHIRLLENSDSQALQQKRLDRSQRLRSSNARFTISSRYRGGLQSLLEKRIIVVDDIVTTLSTMDSAIGLLKSEGFTDVCGAAWLCEM